MKTFKTKIIKIIFCFTLLLNIFGNMGNVYAQQINNGVPEGPGLVVEDCESFGTICNEGKTEDFRTTIVTFLNYFLSFLGILAVAIIVYAGFRMVLSAGNETKFKEGQKMITYAIMGIIVIFLSYAIVRWVVSAPSGGQNNVSVENNPTPSIPNNPNNQNPPDNSDPNHPVIIVGTDEINQKIEDLKALFLQKLGELDKPTPETVDPIFLEFDQQLTALLAKSAEIDSVKRELEALRKALNTYKNIPNQNSFQNIQNNIGTLQKSVTALPRVQAVIKANKTQGEVPFTVQFDGSGSTDPSGKTITSARYEWSYINSSNQEIDLGNGAIVSETFTVPNSYVVKLRIKESEGVREGEANIKITALPSIGKLKLKINDQEVSDFDQYKVTLEDAEKGLTFDPSASEPEMGFTFKKTEWNFGDNTNKEIIEGKPSKIVHSFKKIGRYVVEVVLKDNNDRQLVKRINVEVSSAVADIFMSPSYGTTGVPFTFSASRSRIPNGIKETLWTLKSTNNEKIKEQRGESFTHTFNQAGEYEIELLIRDQEGQEVKETKKVYVASKPPVARIKVKPKDDHHKNVWTFDATESYDIDTEETLSFEWWINNQKINLENAASDNSKGNYTFSSLGSYNITLKLKDSAGTEIEKTEKIQITSLLGIDVSVSPQVAQIQKPVNFKVTSEQGVFFRYDFGDGKKEQTDKKEVQHTYDKSGVYLAQITAFDKDNNDITLKQKVYIADTDTPLATFTYDIKGEIPALVANICGGNDGISVSRVDTINFDATPAINRDGSNRFLTYSWNFGDETISTKKQIIHKFLDIREKDCFRVTLTVTDRDSGKSVQSEPLFVRVLNSPPILRDILVSAPSNTLTPVVVSVSAVGAIDPDGKIQKFRWYYTEAGSDEELGTHITNTPGTTFTIGTRGTQSAPTTYTFFVEMTDNDGALTNSEDMLGIAPSITVQNRAQDPIQIQISSQSQSIIVGQAALFHANVFQGNGAVASDTRISWDFDGDGRADQVGPERDVQYVFQKAGTFNVRAKAEYQGTVSNDSLTIQAIPKTNLIPVAAFLWVNIGRDVIFSNNSRGENLTYAWDFDLQKDTDGDGDRQNDVDSQERHPQITYPTFGIRQVRLRVTDSKGTTDDVIQTLDIKENALPDSVIIDPTKDIQAILITLPPEDSTGVIHLSQQKNEVMFFPGYSKGSITEYWIDKNIHQDTSRNGVKDDDIDNSGTTSFVSGKSISFTYTSQDAPIEAKLTVRDSTGKQDTITKKIVFDDSVIGNDTPSQNTNQNAPVIIGGDAQVIRDSNGNIDIEAMIERIKSLSQDASPVDRIKINRALQSLRSAYGENSEAVQQAVSEIYDVVSNSSTLTNESKSQILGLLKGISDLSSPNQNTNGGSNNENANISPNENQNSNILNENSSIPIPPDINEVPVQGERPLWLNIILRIVSIFLWTIGAIFGLGLLLFIIFLIYKKVTNQDDLDFEEFIIELRLKAASLFQKFSQKKDIPASSSTNTVLKETETKTIQPESDIPEPESKIIETSASDVQENSQNMENEESENTNETSSSPATSQTEENVPSWLKIDATQTQKQEKTDISSGAETTANNTMPDWLQKNDTPVSDSIMNSQPEIPKADNIPDWLKIDSNPSQSTDPINSSSPQEENKRDSVGISDSAAQNNTVLPDEQGVQAETLSSMPPLPEPPITNNEENNRVEESNVLTSQNNEQDFSSGLQMDVGQNPVQSVQTELNPINSTSPGEDRNPLPIFEPYSNANDFGIPSKDEEIIPVIPASEKENETSPEEKKSNEKTTLSSEEVKQNRPEISESFPLEQKNENSIQKVITETQNEESSLPDIINKAPLIHMASQDMDNSASVQNFQNSNISNQNIPQTEENKNSNIQHTDKNIAVQNSHDTSESNKAQSPTQPENINIPLAEKNPEKESKKPDIIPPPPRGTESDVAWRTNFPATDSSNENKPAVKNNNNNFQQKRDPNKNNNNFQPRRDQNKFNSQNFNKGNNGKDQNFRKSGNMNQNPQFQGNKKPLPQQPQKKPGARLVELNKNDGHNTLMPQEKEPILETHPHMPLPQGHPNEKMLPPEPAEKLLANPHIDLLSSSASSSNSNSTENNNPTAQPEAPMDNSTPDQSM